MRGPAGWLIASLIAVFPDARGVGAEAIEAARFIAPTQAYDHGILGDDVEYAGMIVTLDDGRAFRVDLSQGGRVFEDIAPRLWDVTGDGTPEVVVIETDPAVGAQLAVYGMSGNGIAKLAATPHIGQTHRWLSPIGAADFDGDGRIEIAYVDRPHLAKVVRLWRMESGTLRHVADIAGFTNHRIGWDFIAGGVRVCGTGPEVVPEMIVADRDWRRVVALTFDGGVARTRDLGAYDGPGSLTQAQRRCP
ncbi:FG-GAP repeat domain-containing protein [Rhodalgimonas zhirmunskyi]|uniref:VCBS repeat-containing protein n=1 Tax=Rhodalgimonas zhirmunskyi TaxID=2964767 RepID=A0AAJ1UBL1_9RHOB|nr:VCBS repeat-containing protein [Rhodoalgimonas zhirmunskyi]MDQ2094828.1 VCBS repeat-containing protein [Rhodoalgimonas zhirmunskyi]